MEAGVVTTKDAHHPNLICMKTCYADAKVVLSISMRGVPARAHHLWRPTGMGNGTINREWCHSRRNWQAAYQRLKLDVIKSGEGPQSYLENRKSRTCIVHWGKVSEHHWITILTFWLSLKCRLCMTVELRCTLPSPRLGYRLKWRRKDLTPRIPF